MTSIYDDAKRPVRTEVLRLKGLGISIATDEQIAKGRLSNPDFKPNASMWIEWEPRSYKIEGGRYGNSRMEYFPITFGKGLEPDEIEQVRQHGWRGAGNTGKRMSIPATLAEAKERWPYFMVSARAAGMEVSITDDGQLTSPQIGKDFEVESGTVTLPTRIQDANTGKWRDSKPDKGEKAYTPYMRVPKRIVEDYVQPDPLPVVFITTDDDTATTDAPTTTSATGVGSNVTAELLAAACVEAGIIGATVGSLDGMVAQTNITNKFVGRAPVLASKEVQDAAAAGELVNYLVAKGAVSVVDGTIVKEA